MADLNELESRVAVLEKELAELKKESVPVKDEAAWVDRVSGRFKDDSDFKEIIRLGREYRNSYSDETEA